LRKGTSLCLLAVLAAPLPASGVAESGPRAGEDTPLSPLAAFIVECDGTDLRLKDLAIALARRGTTREASAVFDRISPREQGWYGMEVGQCIAAGDLASAREIVRAHPPPEPQGVVRALLSLVKPAFWANPTGARAVLFEAADAARALDNASARAIGLRMVSDAFFEESRRGRAKELLFEATRLALTIPDLDERDGVFTILVDSFPLILFEQRLAIARRIHEPNRHYQALLMLAGRHYGLNAATRGRELAREALLAAELIENGSVRDRGLYEAWSGFWLIDRWMAWEFATRIGDQSSFHAALREAAMRLTAQVPEGDVPRRVAEELASHLPGDAATQAVQAGVKVCGALKEMGIWPGLSRLVRETEAKAHALPGGAVRDKALAALSPVQMWMQSPAFSEVCEAHPPKEPEQPTSPEYRTSVLLNEHQGDIEETARAIQAEPNEDDRRRGMMYLFEIALGSADWDEAERRALDITFPGDRRQAFTKLAEALAARKQWDRAFEYVCELPVWDRRGGVIEIAMAMIRFGEGTLDEAMWAARLREAAGIPK